MNGTFWIGMDEKGFLYYNPRRPIWKMVKGKKQMYASSQLISRHVIEEVDCMVNMGKQRKVRIVGARVEGGR